jgi:hypothetical protein
MRMCCYDTGVTAFSLRKLNLSGNMKSIALSLLCFVCMTSLRGLLYAQAVRVELRQNASQFQLLRNDQPYEIHGVGGQTQLELLKKSGGNSIRTWDAKNIAPLLDEAHKHGLTVCVGLWLGHPRHGFDYHDEAAVLTQLNDCLDAVRKYKDHPAVLLWGIGNEMEGDGLDPSIWYAIDNIAREIKKLDPHHPTMTVIAELGDHKVSSIERFCPNIDIIGVNSYAGIASMPDRYKKAGGSKPYIVTEHGPKGPWEVAKTRWGAPLEASSTAKADQYLNGYNTAVTNQPGLALGSYAFLWGHKQETTATWFGMLLPDGTRVEATDAMTKAWTGQYPTNRSPSITSLELDRNDHLKPGETITATLKAIDHENDSLKVKWILRSDAVVIGEGGDAQSAESDIASAVQGDLKSAKITIPASGGGYRLFAYVYDQHGGASTANIPLFVDAPVIAQKSPRPALPYMVYDEANTKSTYTPSGYMGNTKAIRMTPDSTENPHSGANCLKVEYLAVADWGGVLWQSPPDDWEGDRPGGLDLSGTTYVEFYARGKDGGEVLNVLVGGTPNGKSYSDTSKSDLPSIKLTTDWQRYRIPLQGKDLSRIKTGFGWSLAGQGKPITIYFDQIQFINTP